MRGRQTTPLLAAMFMAVLAATFSHWGMPLLGPPEPTGDSPQLVQEWLDLPPRADVPMTALEASVATYVPPRRWGKNPFLTQAEADLWGDAFAYVGGAGPSGRPQASASGQRLTAIIGVRGRDQVAIIDGVATGAGEGSGDVRVIGVAEHDVLVDANGKRQVLRIAEREGVDVVIGGKK